MIFVVNNRMWRAIVQFSFASPAMQFLTESPLVLLFAFQDLGAHLPGVRVPARLLILSGITNVRVRLVRSKMTEFHIPALWSFKEKIVTYPYHQGHHFYDFSHWIRLQSHIHKAFYYFSKSIKSLPRVTMKLIP